MTRTCTSAFDSRDADDPASMAPGFYAFPHEDYDRAPVGPFSTYAEAVTAARTEEVLALQAVATVAREAAVDAALAAHSRNRAASRHLPTAERKAIRRASSDVCMVAIDEAHAAFRAAIVPPMPPAPVEPVCSAGEARFSHQFTVRLPHHAEPVKACADLRVHLGVPAVDRVTIFPAGTMFATLDPSSDAFRRALREIRGSQAGTIRRRAFELATADAELVEVIPTRFPSEHAGRVLINLSAAIDLAEAAR